MGRILDPLCDLDQIWHVGKYGRHMYGIFDNCQLSGVSLVNGVNLSFAVDLRYCPYNTEGSHRSSIKHLTFYTVATVSFDHDQAQYISVNGVLCQCVDIKHWS